MRVRTLLTWAVGAPSCWRFCSPPRSRSPSAVARWWSRVGQHDPGYPDRRRGRRPSDLARRGEGRRHSHLSGPGRQRAPARPPGRGRSSATADKSYFTTQGDANSTGSIGRSPSTGPSVGRLSRVPELGFAVSRITTPAGRIGLLIVRRRCCWRLRRSIGIWRTSRTGGARMRPGAQSQPSLRPRWLALLGLAACVRRSVRGRLGRLFAEPGSAGNELVSALDWVAPTVSASIIGKSQGRRSRLHPRRAAPTTPTPTWRQRQPRRAASRSRRQSRLDDARADVGGAQLAGTFAIGGATSWLSQRQPDRERDPRRRGLRRTRLLPKTYAATAAPRAGYTVIVDNTAPMAPKSRSTNKTGNTPAGPRSAMGRRHVQRAIRPPPRYSRAGPAPRQHGGAHHQRQHRHAHGLQRRQHHPASPRQPRPWDATTT